MGLEKNGTLPNYNKFVTESIKIANEDNFVLLIKKLKQSQTLRIVMWLYVPNRVFINRGPRIENSKSGFYR